MARRALLLLIGGRQTPNLLSAQHLRPDAIFPIASKEAVAENDAWDRIRPLLERLCSGGVKSPLVVDGFSHDEIGAATVAAFDTLPDAEWFVNVTCGTKVMSIAVHEIARRRGANVWYLDSSHRRVTTLAGEPPSGEIFRISVEEYFSCFNRQIRAALSDEKLSPSLTKLVEKFAGNPIIPFNFRNALFHSGLEALKDVETEVTQVVTADPQFCKDWWWNDLILLLRESGLLNKQETLGGYRYRWTVTPGPLWKFSNGEWLEMWAWEAARRAGCFDNIRRSVPIVGAHQGENELDLAATSGGTLLIAECKTSKNPWVKTDDSTTGTPALDKLNSIAEFVGGKYVTKVFVASWKSPRSQDPAFENFLNQARERQIVVVTGESLKLLPGILKQEALQPTFNQG